MKSTVLDKLNSLKLATTDIDSCTFVSPTVDGKTYVDVDKSSISPALKSFNDTLLFYYLGYLAIKNTQADILEIGIGGSTYPLRELSANLDCILYVNDIDPGRLDRYCNSVNGINDTKTKKVLKSSTALTSSDVTPLGYVHIDGDKKYSITLNDLKFSYANLSPMGLICQDDYGNNKWPTVTNAVNAMVDRNEFEILFVGDSSAWLTRKDDHAAWISLLNQDFEFGLLKELLSIHSSSEVLAFTPTYFFMNSCLYSTTMLSASVDTSKLDTKIPYYNKLIGYSKNLYLKMPYVEQSMTGRTIITSPDQINIVYNITTIWDKIKGPSWPNSAPITEDDIVNLPDWIKIEITDILNLDLFKNTIVVNKDERPADFWLHPAIQTLPPML
jgi:hypothetical protein